MQKAVIIRVTPEDYDVWFREHSGQKEARREYGITDGPIYRDSTDRSTVLVHLDVEDMQKAMGWFKSEVFKNAVRRAGNVKGEVWTAEKLEFR